MNRSDLTSIRNGSLSREMYRNLWPVIVAAVCLSTMAMVSCGGAGSAPISGYNPLGEVSVTITPSVMTVGTTTTETFTATVNNSGLQTVLWEVNGLPGGAPLTGTIDSSGNYTAPQFVPNPPNVTITAVAQADTTKSGNATATITGTLFPAQVFISPGGTAYVQAGTELKLSGGVIGPADTTVDWQVNGIANGNSKAGTITPGAHNTAVYTAPAKVPSPPTVTIKAVSHAEPTRFNLCTVTLSAQPPTIATVTVIPVIAVDQAQTNFTFTADVINVSDNSVSWEVTGADGSPTLGGSEVNGTIGSVNATTGLYTAPAQVPTLSSNVEVTAISNAQPSRGSTATLTISPPPPLGVTVQLKGQTNVLTGAEAQFMATVGNANVQTVTWQVNGITGGNAAFGTIAPDPTIFGQGDYVAPTTPPRPPVVVVGAVPAANPKINATLPVTISPPNVNVSVVCYPTTCLNGTEQLGINETQQFQLQVSGVNDQNGAWYVCTKNSSPSNCVFGGNATLGTISPDQGANLVTYTAPTTVPSPATVIIKAIPEAAPAQFGVATVTISLNAVSVQVSPPGPLTVQTGLLGGPFTANVIGSDDQTVSWYVNNILNGDSTVGTMMPDSQNLNEEDYIAPPTVPNPPTVFITAVPEADPSVVSNKVQVTIIPVQNNITIQISPDPPPPLLPGQSNPNFEATVNNTSNQLVNWTLAPTGGGVCTDPNPPTPCGTISPGTTNNTPTTYTAPNVQGVTYPYSVNITATAQADPSVHETVQQEITPNAEASISITPTQPSGQAGSTNLITFSVQAINIPDFANTEVEWQMSCDSLAPAGENCGPQPNFGRCFPDGGGPGLIQYDGVFGEKKLCGEGDLIADGGETFTYQTPKLLGPSYMAIPQCNTSSGQTDGFVAMTVVISGVPNCPGNLEQCEATVCIDISPPSEGKIGPGKEKIGPTTHPGWSEKGITPPAK
jgi:hypothetical protein